MNRKDDQAGSHCPEPLTRQPLSADEISVLECMALMEEEDRAAFIRGETPVLIFRAHS
ncbi:TPA: hypothetical protein N2B50_006147 [Pseudomonas aeruginosa]|nr:hypothetical protein [Pseudomonas aeruginosa]HCL3907310.1 hypothetical protein [Pseudomonas aeruginosa]